jgi:hypothetical protein
MITTIQREGLVKKSIVASLLLLMLVLAACSNLIQPNPTAIPILTVSAAASPSLLLTETVSGGKPASAWKGIPIMPGAISGEGDEEGYVFTVKATPQQVQDYYQTELGKLGWQLSSRSEEGSSLILLFMNSASSVLTVNVLARQDTALVLLSE